MKKDILRLSKYSSKYPIEEIERDFVMNRLKIRELVDKYSVKLPFNVNKSSFFRMIAYFSTKYHWVEKRNEFHKEVSKEIEKKEITMKADEEIQTKQERIEAFKRIVETGISLVQESLEKIQKGEQDVKIKVKSAESLLNALSDASKHAELLEGNSTENFNINDEERIFRLDRIKRMQAEN